MEKMIDKIKNLNQPVLLVGAAGVGKTEKILQAFDKVEVLLLSAETEDGIAGIPYRQGEVELRTKPRWLQSLEDADKDGKTTCLFLDEIDKAERTVADTLLTLVASRRVGNNFLPKETRIFLAANPPEYGGGDGLSEPMMNRVIALNFNPSPLEWGEWARNRFKSTASIKVIESVENGEIPILECVGTGIEHLKEAVRLITILRLLVDAYSCRKRIEKLRNPVSGLLGANESLKIKEESFLMAIEQTIIRINEEHIKKEKIKK